MNKENKKLYKEKDEDKSIEKKSIEKNESLKKQEEENIIDPALIDSEINRIKNNLNYKNQTEKWFYYKYLNIPLFLGGVAFVLILLTGIFNGVSILTILWRILTYGLIFFVLGFVISIILKNFIPEIWYELNNLQKLGSYINILANDDNDLEENKSKYNLKEDDFKKNENDLQNYDLDDDLIEEKKKKDDKEKFINKDYKIPNDPETLAKGIRTILNQDK